MSTTLPDHPAASRYMAIHGRKMHYLDDGQGKTILFVHGIPEWSMLYASIVSQLSPGYRCIVPDHLGFGLSDRDDKLPLTPLAHAQRLVCLIKELDLSDIHLVVHDMGGSIGLRAAVEVPERVSSVTLTNTFCWDLRGTSAARGLSLMDGRIGRWLYLDKGFSVKVMAANAFADRNVYHKYQDTFLQVHQAPADRYANYILMMEMLRSGKFYHETLQKFHKLHLPGQIVWGMRDKFFSAKEYLTRWQREMPGYKVTELRTSGHFPQLEATVEYAKAIADFIITRQ
ncbi:MAG: alpha/beta fold hydrolase [Bacteroidetes bacterium]|nr:alpha/beta fold hydrolase [Bacteroidota bacterium]